MATNGGVSLISVEPELKITDITPLIKGFPQPVEPVYGIYTESMKRFKNNPFKKERVWLITKPLARMV